MGFTRERVSADGKVRYAATYRDLRGRQRSAGTFSNRRQADRAWQRAEGKVAEGYLGDPSRGRQPSAATWRRRGFRTTRSRRAPGGTGGQGCLGCGP